MKCKDKKPYLTEREAKNYCKSLWRKSYKRLYYYKCELCGNYHLSKTKPLAHHVQKIASGVRRY